MMTWMVSRIRAPFVVLHREGDFENLILTCTRPNSTLKSEVGVVLYVRQDGERQWLARLHFPEGGKIELPLSFVFAARRKKGGFKHNADGRKRSVRIDLVPHANRNVERAERAEVTSYGRRPSLASYPIQGVRLEDRRSARMLSQRDE